jgi:glycine oxidase
MNSQGPRVAVVGAGVIGLWCALFLAQRGARVTVIERAPERAMRGVRFGAESASAQAAGMLAPFSETLHEPTIGAHPDGFALRLAGLRAWRSRFDLLDGEGIGGPFGGALVLAQSQARADAVSQLAVRAHEAGGRLEWLDRAALDEYGGAICGLVLHDEGLMHPRPALIAIAAAAAAHGVRFRAMAAEAIHQAPGGWRVVGDDAGEALQADEIVLAPGAWADARLIACAPELSVLQPASGCVIEVEGLCLPRTVRADTVYVTGGGSVQRIGGGMLMRRRSNDVDSALRDQLLQDAQALLGRRTPAGRTVRECVRAVRGGVRPLSPDGAPMIGRARDSAILIAAGHGRNGWLLAPLTGEMIAACIFEEPMKPLWSAFSPNRFERALS